MGRSVAGLLCGLLSVSLAMWACQRAALAGGPFGKAADDSVIQAAARPDAPAMVREAAMLITRDRGSQLYEQGRYAEAIAEYEKAVSLAEGLYGKDHLEVAACLNNLAVLYRRVGEHAKAEPLLLRGLDIREARLGEDHLDVATVLGNLASLYMDVGQFAKAESLLLRSLRIREAKLGADAPDVATTLNNLAAVYKSMGQFPKAEPLYLHSLKIAEARRDKDHPEVAITLNNLAGLYLDMGQAAKAESLYLRSLEIRESRLGKDHPDVAASLNNLAYLYMSTGQHAKAEPLYIRSLEILARRFGRDHPKVATSLNNLAWLYRDSGQLDRAFAMAERARDVLSNIRSRAGQSGLERSAALEHIATVNLLLLPALALKTQPQRDALAMLEQAMAIGQRESLAAAKADLAAPLPEADAARVNAALASLNALSARLAEQKLVGRPLGDLPDQLRRAEIEYDALMAELAKRHEQFVAAQTAKAITAEQMTRSIALDDKTAVVGWIALEDWAWGYVVRPAGVQWVELKAGSTTQPEELDRRGRIVKAAGLAGANLLFAADLATHYRRWLAPLDPHLMGVEKLIVMSQGWAARIPVEMLLTDEPAAGDRDGISKWPWLANKYQVSYAPSCTMLDILVRQRAARKDRTWDRTLFVLADPPFSEEQLAAMKAEEQAPAGSRTAATPDAGESLAKLLRLDLTAVPCRLLGTRLEARMVAALAGVKDPMLLVGPKATERELFAASKSGELRKSRYVHMATHGYADGDRPELSALVLAQAPKDGEFDGILQMREVLRLRLDADMVVLSACQTGLGKDMRGEGVVGLSTSFLLTGTPTVVMSLWNVSDASTALLMQRLYQNLLAGRPKAAALREAKNWLRNLTRQELEKLGRQDVQVAMLTRGLGQPTTAPKGEKADDKLFAHPHYWAGFILTGDPGQE